MKIWIHHLIYLALDKSDNIQSLEYFMRFWTLMPVVDNITHKETKETIKQ